MRVFGLSSPLRDECLSTRPGAPAPGFFFALPGRESFVPQRTDSRRQAEHHAGMKPKFTDTHNYPRGYVFSGATDITKTFAAARKRFALARKQPDGNVRMLPQVATAMKPVLAAKR